jgi:radical SAM enzyme (rSAM/lipoprotein system)
MLTHLKFKLSRYLFQKFKEQEANLHEISYLFWECTARCNLNCLHCGSDCSKDSIHPDMPVDDFLKAIDSIKHARHPVTVVLTGGEPLLRKDIETCGRELRKRGFRWSIVSNGYLYDESRHNSLLNAGMGALTFSLDGLGENHNWLRNSHTIFKKVDKAIELAAGSSRLNFDVVTCVNQRNISELQEIYSYLLQKGVKAWRLFTIAPIGRAASNEELILKPGQLKLLMDFIAGRRAEKMMDVKFSCEGYVGAYENRVRDGFFFCRAGINIVSVLIDGSISACPNIDRSFAQGNIYRDDFFKVWQAGFQDFRNREWTRKGQCADCKNYKYCQGNGLHYWHGSRENVLVCHKEQLDGQRSAVSGQQINSLTI